MNISKFQRLSGYFPLPDKQKGFQETKKSLISASMPLRIIIIFNETH